MTSLKTWLGGRFGELLVGCARSLRVAPNGTCRSLDSQSPAIAARYGEVADVTEESRDDNVSRVMNRTAEDQLAFVRAVEEYRSTLGSYRAAVRRGETAESRALARNVSRDAGQVTSIGKRLVEEYEIIAGNSTINVSVAREITAAAIANVSGTTTEIRTTEFERPELRFSTNDSTVSFTDPALLQGQLLAENGTGLANRTVVVNVSERSYRTTTDADGGFSVLYRPTTAPTGPVNVTARYVPREDARYVTARAWTDLTIRAANATVTLTQVPASVSFGDAVRVQGRLHINGIGVGGVPVAVSVEGVQLAEVETNETGAFTAVGRLPANVPSGDRRAEVAVSQDIRAIDSERRSAEITVESMEPRLSVRTNRLNASAVRIAGNLFAGETPVPGAVLEIRHRGDTLATVTTSSEGTFDVRASLPELRANASTSITVSYDPSGGNINATTLQVPVRAAAEPVVPDAVGDNLSVLGWLSSVNWFVVSVGTLGLFFLLLITSSTVYGEEIRTELETLAGRAGVFATLLGTGDRTDHETDQDAVDPKAIDEWSDGSTLLSVAQSQVDEGNPDWVVVAAYGAARRALDARLDVDASLTHWELLAVHGNALDQKSLQALEQLTAAYERSAFSPLRSSDEAGNEALKNASILVNGGSVSESTERSPDE